MIGWLRRRWLTVVIVLALVVGGLVWWLLGRPGAPSQVAAFLPAEGVSAALFLDDPAELLVALQQRFTVGEAGRAEVDERIDRLGFDPREALAWERIGVDEGAGVAAVLYGRTGLSPIVLVDVDDEARFHTWLNRVFAGDDAAPVDEGDIQRMVLGRTQLLLGRRGPFTAVMRAGDARRADFEAFIKADKRLITERSVRRAFRDADTRPRMVAFARLQALLTLRDAASDAMQQGEGLMSWLARLAPEVSGFFDDTGGAVRISIAESMLPMVKAWIEIDARPPTFSRLLPVEQWSAIRLSVRLPVVIAFLNAQISAASNADAPPGWLPYADGLIKTVERLGDRLSGHLVIAAANTSLSTWLARPEGTVPDWFVFAHLAKPVDPKLLADLPAPVRQVGDVLVFGATEALVKDYKPLARDVEPPAEHLILDSGVLFAMTIKASELRATLEGAVPVSVSTLFNSSELARKPRLSIGFAQEAEGDIVSRGDAGALLATAGIAALLVTPELTRRRYVRREREARVFLRRMVEGALIAWRQQTARGDGFADPPRFPASVGPTPQAPPTRFCNGYPGDATAWDSPGWRALAFRVFGRHYYQYSFTSDPSGFTARAVGDLDCDGALSVIEVIGEVESAVVDGVADYNIVLHSKSTNALE